MTGIPEVQAIDILSRCLDLPPESCRQAALRSTPQWDSFAHVEVIVEVEERTGAVLTQEQVNELTTFDSLVRLLSSLTPTE